MRVLRDLEHLAGLDEVRIGQLIAIRVEDFHVRVRIAEQLLGNLTQRVARFDGVGRLRLFLCRVFLWRRGFFLRRRAGSGRFDVGYDLLLPARHCLDGVPYLVCLIL